MRGTRGEERREEKVHHGKMVNIRVSNGGSLVSVSPGGYLNGYVVIRSGKQFLFSHSMTVELLSRPTYHPKERDLLMPL